MKRSRLLKSGEKNSAVSKKNGLSSFTVLTISKNREVILSSFEKNLVNTKKYKKYEKEDIDKALLCWFLKVSMMLVSQ